MKTTSNLVPSFVLIAGIVAGCTHQTTPPPAPVRAPEGASGTPRVVTPPTVVTHRLITTFGEHSVSGSWKVRVPEAERTVEVGWQGSSQQPSGWRAQGGWFVLVENDQRIWAYDGDRNLLLFEFTPTAHGGNSAVSGPTKFGCPVPDAVLTRLSAAARDAIK